LYDSRMLVPTHESASHWHACWRRIMLGHGTIGQGLA
jgi:hypothetical protein